LQSFERGFKPFGYLLLALAAVANAQAVSSPTVESAGTTSVLERFARMPLSFEENKGQVNPAVKFVSRAPGYQVFLTANEVVVALDEKEKGKADAAKAPRAHAAETALLRLSFDGANRSPAAHGAGVMTHNTSYFRGTADSDQIRDVISHSQVRYSAMYPGVDLIFYGTRQELEYDFQLEPHANPNQIRMRVSGQSRDKITKSGDLVLTTAGGDLVLRKPVAFQDIQGVRKQVDVRYRRQGDGSIGFQLAAYDRSRPLTIDPILSYSSNLWGNDAEGIAVDSAGNAYLVGSINVSDLPATGYQKTRAGTTDAYVLKLNPAATAVIYASYLGARNASTIGTEIAVDAGGNAYIAGTTNSASFPVTAGAYQTAYSAGSSFVTKFNSTGSALVYSTFISAATIKGLRVDAGGNAFLAGAGNSLITTPGAYKRTISVGNAPFVAKLNAAGNGTIYATYLAEGGTSDAIRGLAIDSGGNAYLTGVSVGTIPAINGFQSNIAGAEDAVLTKLNATGTAIVYSTYLGGAGKDIGNAVAVDASGNAYVTGLTYSDDFPVTQGSFQPAKGYPGPKVSNAFVSKFNSNGSQLMYSSYLGGKWCLKDGVSSCVSFGSEGIDVGSDIAVDAGGYAYVGGFATSIGFPLVDAIYPLTVKGDEARSPFVAKIRPLGDRLVYSVIVGGRGQYEELNGIALDPAGSVYAAGRTSDTTFPLTPSPLNSTCCGTISKLSTGKYPTTLESSRNPATIADTVVLSALVQSTVLNGTVTFYDDGQSIGSAGVVGGVATLSTPLARGVHKLTATYSGDSKQSPILLQTIDP
jgi:hypothetical protein